MQLRPHCSRAGVFIPLNLLVLLACGAASHGQALGQTPGQALGPPAPPVIADAPASAEAVPEATVEKEAPAKPAAPKKAVRRGHKTRLAAGVTPLPRYAHYPPPHIVVVGVDWTRLAARPLKRPVLMAPHNY